MPLKNVHYQKLETEESEGEEDELPPSHVKLQGTNHVKGKVVALATFTFEILPFDWRTTFTVRSTVVCVGDRWNHIDNLDEFFERVSFFTQAA